MAVPLDDPRIERLEPCEHTEQGRLARADLTGDHNEPTADNGKVNVSDAPSGIGKDRCDAAKVQTPKCNTIGVRITPTHLVAQLDRHLRGLHEVGGTVGRHHLAHAFIRHRRLLSGRDQTGRKPWYPTKLYGIGHEQGDVANAQRAVAHRADEHQQREANRDVGGRRRHAIDRLLQHRVAHCGTTTLGRVDLESPNRRFLPACETKRKHPSEHLAEI